MKETIRHRITLTGVFVFLAISLPLSALGGVPEVSHVMVTDVTPRSFSVIWASSEASTADLEVYEDPDGTVPVTGAVITPHPVESGDATIATLAENKGVMKARVTGLSANTTYYFRTVTSSKATADITYHPASEPFMSVTTESLTVRTYTSGADILPFSNDVIIEPCYLDDGTTPAAGTILLATIEDANHPLTAFVGDGVSAPNALIDLNNAFGRESNENMDCSQGENLTLLNFRGVEGYSIVTHEIPQDQLLTEVQAGQFAIKQGWNMVSFQLEPGDTGIRSVLDPIWDQVDAAWAYDASNEKWLSIDKSIPEFLWDLTEGHAYTGYWLVMNAQASLLVNGGFSQDTKQLYPGWNLVGGKSIETVNLLEAVASIYERLEAVWTYDAAAGTWLSMDKSVPEFLWDLFTMEPGKAYWFVMNENCNDAQCQW